MTTPYRGNAMPPGLGTVQKNFPLWPSRRRPTRKRRQKSPTASDSSHSSHRSARQQEAGFERSRGLLARGNRTSKSHTRETRQGVEPAIQGLHSPRFVPASRTRPNQKRNCPSGSRRSSRSFRQRPRSAQPRRVRFGNLLRPPVVMTLRFVESAATGHASGSSDTERRRC